MAITYTKATETDIDYLLWLRRETMGQHLKKSGISLTRDEQLLRVNYLFDQAKIVYLDNEKIGLLKLDDKENIVEIVQVQIDPIFQGKGLGRQIVASVIEKALKQNKQITLSVLKENPARELYLRMGFKIIGQDDASFNMLYDNQTANN
jgi:ribosomal protein S18 acetylase RimI-like enzyme